MFKNKIFNNASWIIGGNIAKSLMAMIIGMLSARYLGPSNYGIINYAASIVAFLAPVANLGLNNIIVQELISDPENEGTLLGTSIGTSLISCVFCMIGVVAFSMVANKGETVTIIVCGLYSFILIFQCLNIIQYWFQAKYLSKYTSIVMMVSYIGVSSYKIFLLATGKNIYWFAVSRVVEYMFFLCPLFLVYKKMGGNRFTFNVQTAKKLLSKSRYYIIPGIMITIFAQTDKIMINLMIGESYTGFYSAAVTCAGITSFVFGAIIDSFRPSIFENHKISQEWFEKSVSRLYCVIIYLSLAQCVGITLFAKLIIYILYGTQYLPAVPALRIIVWYTTFSYLGSVRNIWILAENKQQYLWIINLGGTLANVVLNYILIPIWGIEGAALASLVTQIFTNVIFGFIIPAIRHNNTLMMKGLNLNLIFELIKQERKNGT